MRANGELRILGASLWKYPKSVGTLGIKSMAAVRIPHERIERKLVPIPKQITRPFWGGLAIKASGKWAIYFVIGVNLVTPMPFTKSSLSNPFPVAITVAA
jgi:hypothetical protein